LKPYGLFPIQIRILVALTTIIMRVLGKNDIVMQNFWILGASGGGGDHFLTKPPKGTSLADFTRFEPLCVQIRSRVLSVGD